MQALEATFGETQQQFVHFVAFGDSLLFFPKCVFSLQGEKDLKMLTFSPDGEKLTHIQVFFTLK